MLVMSASKGQIRPILGKKMAVTTNHLGWEVQKYIPTVGWKGVSPIVKTEGLAEDLKDEMIKKDDAEYRVYEAVVFPVKAGY